MIVSEVHCLLTRHIDVMSPIVVRPSSKYTSRDIPTISVDGRKAYDA